LAVVVLLVVAHVIGCNGMFYLPDARIYSTPASFGVRCEDVYFDSADGTRLNGWYLHADDASGPRLGTVVHFHGNAQNLTSHVYFAEWLTARGLDVFVFDYRGYGRSAGSPSRGGIHADAIAALDYVRSRPDVDAERIVVLGQSLGGAIALGALGEGDRSGVRAVAVDSTYLWYRDVANEAVGGTFLTYPLVWLLISNAHSPGHSIDRLAPIPIHVFHGDADRVVPMRCGRALFDAAPEPKTWTERAGGRHLETFHEPSPERELLVRFFHAALDGDGAE